MSKFLKTLAVVVMSATCLLIAMDKDDFITEKVVKPTLFRYVKQAFYAGDLTEQSRIGNVHDKYKKMMDMTGVSPDYLIRVSKALERVCFFKNDTSGIAASQFISGHMCLLDLLLKGTVSVENLEEFAKQRGCEYRKIPSRPGIGQPTALEVMIDDLNKWHRQVNLNEMRLGLNLVF